MAYTIILQLIETDASGLVTRARLAVKQFEFGEMKHAAVKAFADVNAQMQHAGGKQKPEPENQQRRA